jgi:hypothetical protein
MVWSIDVCGAKREGRRAGAFSPRRDGAMAFIALNLKARRDAVNLDVTSAKF